MPLVTHLGFPRIGARRELKKALESHWRGESDANQLLDTARQLRERHWALSVSAGADVVPCNDFSLYDHVLDTAVLFGAVPQRHRELFDADPLAGYFAMARGQRGEGAPRPALEMTKWFDTNYHYLVPELHAGQGFALHGEAPLDAWREAKALGYNARPVLLGPVSFLRLSKATDGSCPMDLLEALLPAYVDLLQRMAAAGVPWLQLDEPCLVTDLDDIDRAAYQRAYAVLGKTQRPNLLLATYFGGVSDVELLASLTVDGVHLDLCRAPKQLDAVLGAWPRDRVLSLGVVDGRNVWRSQPAQVLPRLRQAIERHGPKLWLAPSCSLLHVPIDAREETRLAPKLRSWLAFARQKIEELRHYAAALDGRPEALAALDAQQTLLDSRAQHPGVVDAKVRSRLAALSQQAGQRRSSYHARHHAQQRALNLPELPTTTIGSFPQTPELRRLRADHRAGRLSQADYERALEKDIEHVIRAQESIGLDVLVHGEPERNDMVEYFGEQLAGYAFTRLGWVQSYGSRCVKPPLIFGDVSRPAAMTVRWSRYAQSLTKRPVKGMLTGPVTMLQWSFVRDDLPRDQVCAQIALALRDEVHDLERAGIGVIQVDEPALREGLPLRRSEWDAYLDWAVQAFRVAVGGVADSTQIHSHMCYSEFNDIIGAVAAMDADVVSIEASRSHMELLEAFVDQHYPNAIGPGLYDIHSPHVPDTASVLALLDKALAVLDKRQLWVNPDCGLKTRQWSEVEPALRHMVAAARARRQASAHTDAA
ncbi:5-methyltetrahydropteroyltriglutamate--homocysteine S-methyltransferase [Oleiagrimonas sp. C23AA]|uniref:5-methyltetrahydropteroyltriglutamate-- homocysteine S-methyltransferase n=1 Tax=Oleiagrimonas sp. C23AA TaxID=2719047 RepID=UPI0014246956|nr:5-methyltetrahydropteroyltriglutamate--homocysteine S-methyltransferase [Oleiagrimonas sp. C23AA]NII09888.1 5-methyltetrahydropteroyltriglutamate--homocysteine S-methyltransferase [Oleiagrimonas sp. C23AA]